MEEIDETISNTGSRCGTACQKMGSPGVGGDIIEMEAWACEGASLDQAIQEEEEGLSYL